MGLVLLSQNKREQRPKQKSSGGQRKRESEESESLCVEVEKVTHRERVVGGILLQELRQIGVGCGCAHVQQKDQRTASKDRTNGNQNSGNAQVGATN